MKKNNKKRTKKETKKTSFLKSVKTELKRVTWPDKKDVIKYSIATLIFCVVIMLFFQLLDFGLSVIKGVFN